jgi:hypothetical protein
LTPLEMIPLQDEAPQDDTHDIIKAKLTARKNH